MLAELTYWNKAATDRFVKEKYISDLPDKIHLREIEPLMPDNGNVLEIGCGIGRLTTVLAKKYKGVQVYGVDISSLMVQQAPKSSVKYTVNDGRTLPYKDNYFNYIYSVLVFQHIPDDAKIGYINEASRCLKHNGLLLIQYVTGTYKGLVDYNTNDLQMADWLYQGGLSLLSVQVGRKLPQWSWILGVKK